jgi:hypothetical protein
MCVDARYRSRHIAMQPSIRGQRSHVGQNAANRKLDPPPGEQMDASVPADHSASKSKCDAACAENLMLSRIKKSTQAV